MKLPPLNFDGPNNGCHSLRVLAEHVRTGEIKIVLFDVRPKDGMVRVDFQTVQDPGIRKS